MAEVPKETVAMTGDPLVGACSGPAWFCIRSHPKHEHIAAARLRQIPGIEVFNPQLRLERLTRRGRVRSTESLFVNYLFARFVLETLLEQVRHTPSVKTVVEFGGRVATVPDAVIKDLQCIMAQTADVVLTDGPLEGEEAEIGFGPFQGEKGIVTRVLPARQRVQLLLEVMGRALPAEVSLSSILFSRQILARRMLSTGPTLPRDTVAVAV